MLVVFVTLDSVFICLLGGAHYSGLGPILKAKPIIQDKAHYSGQGLKLRVGTTFPNRAYY